MDLQVVDFAKCSIEHDSVSQDDLKSAGDSIYKSFTTLGFVYLKNTGISDEEARKIHSLSKRFFDLNETTKNKYAIDARCFGYVAPGVENNDPSKPGEFKETFDVSGPGLMSEESKWPDVEIPSFSSAMKAFMEKLRRLAIRIIEVLTVGMKLKDTEYLLNCHSRINGVRNVTTLRSLYYPVIPSDYVIKTGEMRLGEHTDFGSFTILFQDYIGGLQVKRQDGVYIDATPIPGTALINIGDALQFWTRGRLKSTEHRILMPDLAGKENQERSSLVYFVMPDNEAVMSEIECDVADDDQPPLDGDWQPVTVLEHIQRKYREVNLPVPT